MPTPTPVIRVVVVHVSSGSGWVTLTVAIAGVVLSLASLGWQAFSFWRSGYRIRVELGAGAAGQRHSLVQARGSGFPVQEVMAIFAAQGFDMPVLIADVRNVGRLPVTVHQCWWETSSGASLSSQPVSTYGDSFPRRLEAGDHCQAVVNLAPILAMLGALTAVAGKPSRKGILKARGDQSRMIFAVADLGTGKTIRSKPLEMPDQSSAPAAPAPPPVPR